MLGLLCGVGKKKKPKPYKFKKILCTLLHLWVFGVHLQV